MDPTDIEEIEKQIQQIYAMIAEMEKKFPKK
jgi:hypothetical protein